MQRRLLIAGTASAGTALFNPAGARLVSGTRSLIEQFAATLTAHDITAFAALFADDYVNHRSSAAAPPKPVDKTAKQATVDFFAARLTGIPDLRVIIETAMVSSTKVAASFIYAGTHGGTFFGIAPTGRTLRFTSCDIFLIRNGLFAEHWGMGDIAGILAQLRS